MRVFIADLDTTLGRELTRLCQDAGHEVVGTVSTRAVVGPTKRHLQAHPASDTLDAVSEPVVLQSDRVGVAKLAQRANVAITSLARNTKSALDVLQFFDQDPNDSSAENDTTAATTKRFVAISSVLTWSRNPPYAKGTTGHKEADFKTRKPLRQFADLKTAETHVLSAQRTDQLETVVISSGLIYGGAESQFELLFRHAWMSPEQPLVIPSLPGCPQDKGMNVLPAISVYDLALLIFQAAIAPELTHHYILATDQPSQSTTLRDLCVGLSTLLGTGEVRDVLTAQEQDDLLVDEPDGAVAPLQLHLCFDNPNDDSAMLKLVPKDEYRHVESGLLANLAWYVADFIASMDLRPLHVIVLGPPRVGKTSLCTTLAKTYDLPLLTVAALIDEVESKGTAAASAHAVDELVPDASTDAQTAPKPPPSLREIEFEQHRDLRQQLRTWRDTNPSSLLMELPEDLIIRLFRWKLCTSTCRNQGYILDGIPNSVVQATRMFEPIVEAPDANGEDARAEETGEKAALAESPDGAADGEGNPENAAVEITRSQAILAKLRPEKQIHRPNRVIVLDAPREILEKRAQALTEDQAIATANTEAAFATRFAQFEMEREPLITFFEQQQPANDTGTTKEASEDEESKETEPIVDTGLEVLELRLADEAAFGNDDSFAVPVKTYVEQGGKPNNFHPTPNELREQERAFARKKEKDDAQRRQREHEEEERESAEMDAKRAADRQRLALIEREEIELLEARAKPLRDYLMDTVLPALTEGMLEVVKVQPDDPIDYLAEFLFKKGKEMEELATA